MKKGERIELIRRIAHRLEAEDYREIDLVLQQFDLPWLDKSEWDNNRNWDSQYNYVLSMIGNTSDEILIELEEYLLPSQSIEIEPDDDTRIWKPNHLRAFCSHITADKELVSNVKIQLADYNIDCFVAHEAIRPLEHWHEVLDKALRSCNVLLVFLTDDFHKSNWTDQEIGFCVARKIPIIPIKCNVAPYGFITFVQAITAAHCDPVRISTDVYKTLATRLPHDYRMSDSVVQGFITSKSFEAAKNGVNLLQKLLYIKEDDLTKIADAVETNPQIKGAYGVPDKVEMILEKHRKAQ